MRAGDERLGARGVCGEPLTRPTELHRERDEPLLDSVVQVALNATTLCLRAVDGRRTARLERADARCELFSGRRAEQSDEPRHARSRPGRRWRAAQQDRHREPDKAGDHGARAGGDTRKSEIGGAAWERSQRRRGG